MGLVTGDVPDSTGAFLFQVYSSEVFEIFSFYSSEVFG
jgi:hypothetical protein